MSDPTDDRPDPADQETQAAGPPPPVGPETALARTLTVALAAVFLVGWWNTWDWGALWMLAAAAVFLAGELTPSVFRPLLPLWWLLAPVLRPVVFALLQVWRAVVPERYRAYRPPPKPMSMKELFAEINKAIDEEEARKKREGDEPPKR